MTRTRLTAVAVAVAMITAGGTGCTPDPTVNPTAGPTATSGVPTPTSTATPSVTPSSPTSEPTAPGRADVIVLVKRYYVIDDAVARNRSVPVSRYKEVATGSWSKTIRAYRTAARLRGQRIIGKTKVGEPMISGLKPAADPTSARARVCLDVRKVRAVNSEGKSIVPKNRPDFFIERLALRKTTDGWRVYEIRNKGVSTC